MAYGDEEQDVSAFEEAKAEARQLYGGMKLLDLVKAMQAKRLEKDDTEKALARINAFYDVLRFEAVPGQMEADGVENVRYEGIGRVSLTGDMLVSTKPGMKGKLYAWLRGHKLGDLIQPSVNSSTLKAFVKQRTKDGKEVPSEFLNVTPITRASITKG